MNTMEGEVKSGDTTGNMTRVQGKVNGVPVEILVDTGSAVVTKPSFLNLGMSC